MNGKTVSRYPLLLVAVVLLLALAACAGETAGSVDTETDTDETAEQTETPSVEEETEATGEEEATGTDAAAEAESETASDAETSSSLISADNARDVELLNEFQGAPLTSYGMTIAPNGEEVAVFGADGVVRVFDVETGEELRSMAGHTGPGYGLAYSPDGAWLASGGEDYRLFMWEVEEAAQSFSLVAETNARDIRFTPDGDRLLFAGPGSSRVFVFNADGNESGRIEEHGRVLGSVDISPDGLLSASGNARGNIVVSELDSLDTVTTLNDGTGILQSTKFSPDGSMLATGSGSGDMWMWNTSDWALERTWKVAHRNGVQYIAWSNDGTVLVSVGTDGRIVLWDPTNARELNSFQSSDGTVWKVDVAPDGTYFATLGGNRATVRIYGLP